jgi:hypothetical protein
MPSTVVDDISHVLLTEAEHSGQPFLNQLEACDGSTELLSLEAVTKAFFISSNGYTSEHRGSSNSARKKDTGSALFEINGVLQLVVSRNKNIRKSHVSVLNYPHSLVALNLLYV